MIDVFKKKLMPILAEFKLQAQNKKINRTNLIKVESSQGYLDCISLLAQPICLKNEGMGVMSSPLF